MPIPLDKRLYAAVKREADQRYAKPSAYKSGYIVQTYKRRGGKYANDHKTRNLKRWFAEKWGDIGHKGYPVYRPFVKVDKKRTPLTASEISPTQAKRQIHLKQIIRGNHNLPKFKAKRRTTSKKRP